MNRSDRSGRYWGEDVVESETEWDETWQWASTTCGCYSAGSVAVEAVAPLSLYASAVATPAVGLAAAAAAAVGGCRVGGAAAYSGQDQGPLW